MSTMQKLKAYFGMIPADEVDDYGDYRDYRPADRYHHQYVDDYRGDYDYDYDYAEPAPWRGYQRPDGDESPRRPWSPPAAGHQAPVRGALAVEQAPEPVARIRPVAAQQHDESTLSRITTLHLTSYNEARLIGEPYRDGTPVIMNLTEMEDADAKRLVDFAAGLAFALRGDIDKITSKVFLLSPPDVNVTAEERKRLAEGGRFSPQITNR